MLLDNTTFNDFKLFSRFVITVKRSLPRRKTSIESLILALSSGCNELTILRHTVNRHVGNLEK